MFPKVSANKIKKVTKLSGEELNLLIQAATGHGLFAAHLAKWIEEMDPLCKLCLEGEETSTHLWEECPALWWERQDRQTETTRAKSHELEIIKFFRTQSVRETMSLNSQLC